MAFDIHKIRSGNIAVAHLGGLMIMVVGPREISDEDWLDFLDMNAELSADQKASLTYSPSSIISGKQRKLAAEREHASKKPPSLYNAVLADSTIMRGVVTAYSWIAKKPAEYKSYRVSELDDALTWMRENVPFDKAEAKRAFGELNRLVGNSLAA